MKWHVHFYGEDLGTFASKEDAEKFRLSWIRAHSKDEYTYQGFLGEVFVIEY